MITKKISDESVSMIPEESDDLFTIRRVVKKGDTIAADTTRVFKQERDEYARPDKGERQKIRVLLMVQSVSLDQVVDRLRIHGTIQESSNDQIRKGSYHSLMIKIGKPFTLTKYEPNGWSAIEKKLVFEKSKETAGFLLVSIDTTECSIGRISGTHVKIIPNTYSGASGKRYKTKFNIENYFDGLIQQIYSTILDKDQIVIFGPGETKRKFANYITSKTELASRHKITVVDGIDLGGEDGIHTFVKSESMKKEIKDSKLAVVLQILDDIMLMVNKGSKKFAMGFEETKRTNDMGAVESIVFSDKIFEYKQEDEVIEFLNNAEAMGAEVFSVDSTTDTGLRVSSLGGIVATLRYVPPPPSS